MGRIRYSTPLPCRLRIVGVLCLDRLANKSRERDDDDVLLSLMATRAWASRTHGSNGGATGQGGWPGGRPRPEGDPSGGR